MYTMNARKINDFYRMLLFTRRALEKGGEYEKFQFSYYVLCGKISFCALWLTARMHLEKRTAAGFLTNVKKVASPCGNLPPRTPIPLRGVHQRGGFPQS